MTTMREKMARAMFEQDFTDDMLEDDYGKGLPKPKWDESQEWHKRFLDMADAAILALKPMIEAAYMAGTRQGTYHYEGARPYATRIIAELTGHKDTP